MKTLVIAEKPSVAKQIAHVVGATGRKEGYLEGGSYVVSWVRGHLVSLKTPDEYEQWAGAWRLDVLPMVPDRWQWRTSKADGAAAQFKVLKGLMEREDVGCVVNACDADREGEGIFSRVYNHARCKKPVRRFWNTSMVDSEIAKALREAKPASEYRGLAAAAEGRAKADWLVGLNATRAYTVLYGPKLNVGRVQTPTLAMVAQRTREADDFVVRDFYQAMLATEHGFELAGERMDTEEKAQREADAALDEGYAVVTSAEYKDVRQAAPKLYDITALQRDANERFGYTAGEAEALLEELYLAKLLTYPRTDSRYITAAEAAEAEAVLPQVAVPGVVGEAAAAAFATVDYDMGKVTNDDKVSGHGALLPTELLTAEAFAKLTQEQRNIAGLVCLRLLSAIMPPCIKRKAEVVATAAGSEYKATSSAVKVAGWTAVDGVVKKQADAADAESDDTKAIPEGLAAGMQLSLTGARVRQGKTTPPKLYTDSTLLSAMQHAGRMIEDKELRAAIDDDSSHSGGLGTPATRDTIIEQLVNRGYIERKGKSIRCTEKGFALVDTVSDSLKSPVLTAEWERELSRVEHGEADLDTFLKGIAAYAGEVVMDAKASFDPEKKAGMERAASGGGTVLGKCPICGADVIDKGPKARSYQCSSNHFAKEGDKFVRDRGCGWSMYKTYRGKNITPARCSRLLEGKTVKLSGLKSKAGKEYAIDIFLDSDGKIDSEFAKRK